VKLAAINAMLQKNQRPMVGSFPPSQIVVTPAQPYQGWRCFLQLQGSWTSGPPPCVGVCGNAIDYLGFVFQGITQGTYLLDISVDYPSWTVAWNYILADGAIATLTPQQGHLLYPFIGAGLEFAIWPANQDMQMHSWNSTELTQVA
jgi:hypothetical protein